MLKFLIVSVLFLSTRGEESHFSHPAQRIMTSGCPSSIPFQYPAGSCEMTCPYPHKNKTVSGSLFCYSPCPDKFFDSAKNTCLDSCPPYFAYDENGIRYCQASTDCPLLDPFINSMGSCTSACSHPFIATDLGDGTYDCQNPCSGQYYDVISERCVESCEAESVRDEENILYCDTRNRSAALCPGVFEYKYENGSCLPGCNEPYYSDDESYPQCKLPCEQGQYLDYFHWDCIDSCEPQKTRLKDNILYCDSFSPCSSVYKYKYANGSCLDSCPEPGLGFWFQTSYYFCDVPCPKGQYQNEQYKCVDSCDGEIYNIGEIVHCKGGSNSGSSNASYNATVEIYLRYDISLTDFNSQNYLAKFLALLSTLLADNSEIKIIDIREGSTIIESQIILKSESQDEMKSKTQALSKKLTKAAKSDGLNLEGTKVLNSKFSGALLEENDDDDDDDGDGSSSVKKIAIGVGVGVGGLVILLGAYLIHIYRKKKRLLKVKKVGTSSQVEAQVRNEEIHPQAQNSVLQAQGPQVNIPDVIEPKAEPFKVAKVELDLEKNEIQLGEKEKGADPVKIEEVKEEDEEVVDEKPPQHVEQENEDPMSLNRILDEIDNFEEKNEFGSPSLLNESK